MPLNDVELRTLHNTLLNPTISEHVNPASIDICIGNKLLIDDCLSSATGHFREVDLSKHSHSNPYLFPPKTFALVDTWEWITVPNNCCVELKLKSSRAREGWNHPIAGWFDPGWSGRGTMEIYNLRSIPIPVYPRLRFAQLVVYRMTSEPSKLYNGCYQNAITGEAAKHSPNR